MGASTEAMLRECVEQGMKQEKDEGIQISSEIRITWNNIHGFGLKKSIIDNCHLFSHNICTGPVLLGVYSQNQGIFWKLTNYMDDGYICEHWSGLTSKGAGWNHSDKKSVTCLKIIDYILVEIQRTLLTR